MKKPVFQENVEEDLKIASSEKYFTTSEAAKALGVSPQTIRRWENEGRLRCIRTRGNHRRIPYVEIRTFQLEKEIKERGISSLMGANPLIPDSPWEPLPRHDYRALKNQMKVLNVLLTTRKSPQTSFLGLKLLLSLITDLTDSQDLPQSLKNACHRFQTEFIALERNLEVDLMPEEEEELPSPDRPVEASSVFQKARDTGAGVFLELMKACHDERLDEEERNRANQLVEEIIEPYNKLTTYLAEYPEKTLKHDVCKLLLLHHPLDFGLARNCWSVRTLTRVCQEFLGTKSASKSQVGRFYKELDWYKPVIRRLLSPDPQFGEKMKELAKIMANMTSNDLLLFGDEFKFTSTKILEYLTPNHAPKGLQLRLKEHVSNFFPPLVSS